MTPQFAEWRTTPREQQRIQALLELIPAYGGTVALDVGARDAYLSVLLAKHYATVVALDLEAPQINHPGVLAVQGNASQLDYPDNSFDLVICAEVLEHVSQPELGQICREICRVARRTVVIGVPFIQDLRVARTTCRNCGCNNPPWGHVNSFDQEQLLALFPEFSPTRIDFVGSTTEATNDLSAALMDFAGNPFGAYDFEEHCLACKAVLLEPPPRNLIQKIATRLAIELDRLLSFRVRPHPSWIHLQLEKTTTSGV